MRPPAENLLVRALQLHVEAPRATMARTLSLGFQGLSIAGGALAWIPSLITDILGSLLLAAPKRRATHQVKRTRQNAPENRLQNKRNITECPFCGEPKLLHHLCYKCYEKIKAKYRLPSVAEMFGQNDVRK